MPSLCRNRRLSQAPQSFVSTIALRVERCRNYRHLTQVQLAEHAGCSRSMILKIEAGIALPSSYSLMRLSRALRVSTDYLLGIKETQDA